MNRPPTAAELEARADALRDSLHGKPVGLEPGDVVFMVDGTSEPWVIPAARVSFASILIGGEDFARSLQKWTRELEPGHAPVVILVGGQLCVTAIGLQWLSKGGDA